MDNNSINIKETYPKWINKCKDKYMLISFKHENIKTKDTKFFVFTSFFFLMSVFKL